MTAAVQGKQSGGGLRRFRDFLTRRPGFLRNVVIFFLTMVVGLIAFLVFVGKEDIIFPWQHETTYYADFSDAASIAPGLHQEVRVAGVHVGDIGSASVYHHGTAHVQLQITKKITIYQNATVLLQAKTPLNEMYMELNPGTANAGVLKPGGTIPEVQTTSPIEVNEILQHFGPSVQAGVTMLLNATNTALANSDGTYQASSYLPTDLNATSATMQSLKPLATALSSRDSEIKALVTDLTQIAGVAGQNQGRLASLLNNAESTLNVLEANDQPLSATLQALPQTTDALGAALPKVQALTGQLNPLLDNVRSAAGVLPTALDKLNSTLQNLDPLLQQLKPVIANGTPVVENLKTYLDSGVPALASLDKIGSDLNPITAYTAYDMPWLNGFFYNTNSLGSLETAGGRPFIRSLVITGASGVGGVCNEIVGALAGELGGSTSAAGSLGTTACTAIQNQGV